MLMPTMLIVSCFVLKYSVAAPFSGCCSNNEQNPPESGLIVNMTDVMGIDVTPKTPTLPFDEESRVIIIVEKRSFIVAGSLVLLTSLVLLIGTIIMSCCGSRSDYHYTILSQGDFFEKIPADMFLTTNHKNLNIKQKYIFVKENLSAGSVAGDKL